MAPADASCGSVALRLRVLLVALAAAMLQAGAGMIFGGLPAAGGIVGKPQGGGGRDDALRLTVGERLRYAIMWQGAHAGDIAFRVERRVRAPGGDAFLVSMRATSRGLLSAAYRIDDTVTSLIDARTGHSRCFTRSLREGTWKVYRADDEVEFDYQRMRLLYHASRLDAAGKRVRKDYAPRRLPGRVQDPLSLFYALRSPVPRPGEERRLLVAGRKRVDALRLRVTPATDLVLPGLGTFPAYRVEFRPRDAAGLKPKVELFLKRGELLLWIDRKHGVPLQLEVRGIPVIGSVRAVLRGARGSSLSPVPERAVPRR